MLIVYIAGFATAIYLTVPAEQNGQPGESCSIQAKFKTNEFAQSYSNSLHKCVDFIKDQSRRAGAFIKEKVNEHRDNS